MLYHSIKKQAATLLSRMACIRPVKWWMLWLTMGHLTHLPAQDLQLYALRDIWNLQLLQPSYMPNKKIAFGFLGLQLETKRQGLPWNDVFRRVFRCCALRPFMVF